MEYKLKSYVIVRSGQQSFGGIVREVREGWVRVTGPGSVEGSIFDEWFPMRSAQCSVYPVNIAI